MSNHVHEGTIYRDVLAGLVVVAALLTALGLAGCIPIPMDKVTSGTELTADETEFLKAGETTRQQITARLGSPSFVWEEKRVIAYDWEKLDAVLLFFGYAGALGFPLSSGHTLLIEFDEAGRVRRHRFTQPGLFQGYQDMVEEWLKNDEGGKSDEHSN